MNSKREDEQPRLKTEDGLHLRRLHTRNQGRDMTLAMTEQDTTKRCRGDDDEEDDEMKRETTKNSVMPSPKQGSRALPLHCFSPLGQGLPVCGAWSQQWRVEAKSGGHELSYAHKS